MSMQLLLWWKPLRCVHVLAVCKVHFIPTAACLFGCWPLPLRATNTFVCWSVHCPFSIRFFLFLFLSFFSNSAVHDGKYRLLRFICMPPSWSLAVACGPIFCVPEVLNVFAWLISGLKVTCQVCEMPCVMSVQTICCLWTGCNVAHLALQLCSCLHWQSALGIVVEESCHVKRAQCGSTLEIGLCWMLPMCSCSSWEVAFFFLSFFYQHEGAWRTLLFWLLFFLGLGERSQFSYCYVRMGISDA